jgi:holo-[acyl-carrier protein] synthase
MIAGIGTDIVPVEMMRRNMRRSAFLRKVFTEWELSECSGKRQEVILLAGKFAVKEAIMKALGSGIRQGVWFTQIEVLNQGGEIHLKGTASALYEALHTPCIHASATQQGVFVVALVILEGREDQGGE